MSCFSFQKESYPEKKDQAESKLTVSNDDLYTKFSEKTWECWLSQVKQKWYAWIALQKLKGLGVGF